MNSKAIIRAGFAGQKKETWHLTKYCDLKPADILLVDKKVPQHQIFCAMFLHAVQEGVQL